MRYVQRGYLLLKYELDVVVLQMHPEVPQITVILVWFGTRTLTNVPRLYLLSCGFAARIS